MKFNHFMPINVSSSLLQTHTNDIFSINYSDADYGYDAELKFNSFVSQMSKIFIIICFFNFFYYFYYIFNFLTFNSIYDLEDSSSDSNSDSDSSEEPAVVKRYEDKYLDKFKQSEIVDLNNEKLENLKNSIVMENTPFGNVIMYWDNKKESFCYYSDHNIPYRYLEVVGRKYVVMNNCKQIFIDMEDELKESERKMENRKKKIEEQEEKRKENIAKNALLNIIVEEPKKNVFAKMKSYNKESIKSSTISLDSKKSGINNSNSNSNSNSNNTKNNEDRILKEKANRYSCGGKLINFSFLKKIDRKEVDQNARLSFADFKKLKK